MERGWIISCGTELTLGQTVDTNAAWLAEQLAAIGIRPERHVTVPDAPDALRDVLLEAARAADVVVLSGGLGPTIDDVTRAAMAASAGVPLETHAPTLERLRAFFAQRGREMPEVNSVQALIPRTGRALPNTCGTAPGIALEIAGTPCFALPGVPFEMQEMFAREVAPLLQAAARGRVLLSRRLRTFGRAEAELGTALADLMTPGRNPDVGTTAELGIISLRLTASAADRTAADALLDETEREIRSRLGHTVFGRDADTLASAAGELLVAAGQTLATAESCTGGLIAKLITDVPGASRYFRGGAVTYANEAKQELTGVSAELLARYGAVSEPVARAMADGARRCFQADFALSVTGVAGPTGGTPEKPVGLVYIGLAGPGGVQVREQRMGGDAPRHLIRARAAWSALNLLRLELLRPAAT